jgi:hypothetical protein
LAPESLLDTCFEERHPEGARVLIGLALKALMRPGQSSRALEAIIRDLIDTQDGATYFAERGWGVAVRYDLGSTLPLVGQSAPNFSLACGKSLGELLTTREGLLLDFDARAPLRAVAADWADRIIYVQTNAEDRLGLNPRDLAQKVTPLPCQWPVAVRDPSETLGKSGWGGVAQGRHAIV